MKFLPNHILSKKSKNSRMGKGKGMFLRWIFRLRRGFIIAEFLGISHYRLLKINLILQKKLKTRVKLIRNYNINQKFTLWSKLNLSIEFFKKYRYM